MKTLALALPLLLSTSLLSQVALKTAQVRARIVDGATTVEIQETFHNAGRRPAEATWILPLPKGAVADAFEMTAGDRKLASEVLDATQARSVYEQIVARSRDPGLLEYLDRGCLRARIFPIPPGGDMGVKVRYRHGLEQTSGLFQWSFPLRALGYGGRIAEQVGVDLEIRSRHPMKSVYSPLPGVRVTRNGEQEARVSFEISGGNVPPRDLDVFYSISEQAFGLDVLTYRKPNEAGYFLMMLSPRQVWAETARTRKAITFVLDTSGSMEGQKIEQARGALRFFLGSLEEGDHFNVVPFATGTEPFFPRPVPKTPANLEKAFDLIKTIRALGGTNIEAGLGQALAAPVVEGLANLVVFLTDGLPTVGRSDTPSLLRHLREANKHGARIFVFGVGQDVNTELLDKLAEESGGARHYVSEQENIEVKTGALLEKLSYPVLTDVAIECAGADLHQLVPTRLPHLFKGSQVLVLGRYKGKGEKEVLLRGKLSGTEKTYRYRIPFRVQATEHDFIPVMWARRRIGLLLDAIRLNGPDTELVQEVTRLGREFQIVTPYTSHLVLEDVRASAFDASSVSTAIGFGGGARPGRRYNGPASRTPMPATPAPTTPGAPAPTVPAPAGPTSPGPSSPGAATTPRPSTGSDNFFMGATRRAVGECNPEARLKCVLEDLQRQGVLPRKATIAQLKEMARRAAEETLGSERRLAGLGTGSKTGRQAVDESRYLLHLLTQGSRRSQGSIAGLFVHRIKDRVFRLRGGVWVDSRYKPQGEGEAKTNKQRKVEVKAFSREYFDLLRKRPELGPFLAFSSKVLVVLDDVIIEVS